MNASGQVLVVNQHGSSWSLPKGHIEPGEDALSAARREVEEESGLKRLRLVRALGTYRRHKIGKSGGEDRSELKRLRFFLFRTRQKRLKPSDPHNPEARWVDRGKVAELLTHPKDKQFFKKILERL